MERANTLKKELLALETRYWNAVMQKDAATAVSLTDETCIVVGAQGVSEIQRQTFAKMMKQGKCDVNSFNLDDVHLRQISDDVVALAYAVDEEVTIEGKKMKFKGFDSSVWKKSGDSWVCVVHTETPAGDPFGRH